jgi:hypothetical protein
VVYTMYESLRKILFSNDNGSDTPRLAESHWTVWTSNY